MNRPAAGTIARQILRAATLGVALALPATALAQPAGGPQMAQPDEALTQAVENYFHFGKLGRYDIAAQYGRQALEQNADPTALLAAFRTAAEVRGDNLDFWLGTWSGVEDEAMREVTGRVQEALGEGRRGVATDPQFIREQIDRLNVSSVGEASGIRNLRQSGEVAVPPLIQALTDPDRGSEHPVFRRALRDLGRLALNPLVAATEADDSNVLLEVTTALGEMGYQDAAPYLKKLLRRDDIEAGTRQAAERALQQLNADSADASQALYGLAERFYYDRSSIKADTRYPDANVWRYEGGRLAATQVPPAIFNEIMAMRAAADALELSQGMDDALSLWIAANFKRAAELPAGETDATRPQDDPGPQYYGVTAGASYVSDVLARGLGDDNPAVALQAIRSLQDVLGDNAVGQGVSEPLIDAMGYPDRRVRFEAAMALASALPTADFEGSQQVVPLLGEALAQTGTPNVIVVADNRDRANQLGESLGGEYNVASATSANEVVQLAQSLSAVDVVVIEDQLPPGEVDRVTDQINAGGRTRGAARLVIAAPASRFEQEAQTNRLLSTTTATGGEPLADAVERAREKAGALAIDDDDATGYALRAGRLLVDVSNSNAGVYNLSAAKGSLLGALDDEREAVVLAAADVLGNLDDADAQLALLQAAGEADRSADARVGLFEALAENARNFGNRLDAGQVQTLRAAVTDEPNLEIREAAGKAYGALDLPAEQAKQLVIDAA